MSRACEEAGVEVWTPHGLRHNAGTRVRAAYGVEGAQAVLGHGKVETTQIYAEMSAALAVRIAREMG